MNGNDLLDKMNLVDPAYVEAADEKPANKKRGFIKWGAMAACLALLVVVSIKMIPQNAPEEVAQLPKLTVTKNTGEAMGFEGYNAYNVSELVNANPWDENKKISKLPVYKNSLTYNEQSNATGADLNAKRELLTDIAKRMGFDKESIKITDNAPDAETQKKIIEKYEAVGDTAPDGYNDPTSVIFKTDELKIEVDQTMTAEIHFEPAISLPDKYNFTHNASYEDISVVAEYLKDEYSSLIGFDHPQINICGGDYSIGQDGQKWQNYSIEFFDISGNNVEQIVNYNFNRVVFYCNDDGKLFLARVFAPNLAQKVADYPLITADEAKSLLVDKKYITTVPYDFPGKEFVGKVELIYRTGKLDKYFIPFYKFYVEIPNLEKDGMKTYGAYYVPAVKEAYISNMPKWDGSFN